MAAVKIAVKIAGNFTVCYIHIRCVSTEILIDFSINTWKHYIVAENDIKTRWKMGLAPRG